MNTFIIAAVQLGQVWIDFKNHNICLAQNLCTDTGRSGKVKKTMFIHRCDAHHGNVDVKKVLVIG